MEEEEIEKALKPMVNTIKMLEKNIIIILDFSKIESGKMDIYDHEYELSSVLLDISVEYGRITVTS